MHLFYAPHLQRKDRAAVGISMEPLHLKSRELSKKHIHQLFILCRVADGNDAVLGIGFPYGIRKLMPLCRTKPSYRSSIHQLSYWGGMFFACIFDRENVSFCYTIGAITCKFNSSIWLKPLSAVIRGKLFTMAEAAIIASGSFVLYFLRISIVFSFISFDRAISLQSFIKALMLCPSVSVIPEKDKSSIVEIIDMARFFSR